MKNKYKILTLLLVIILIFCFTSCDEKNNNEDHSTDSGTWVLHNNTDYYVQVKSSDLSQTYAELLPQVLNVSVPIVFDEIYDYILVFSRELKFNGIVIGIIEFMDPMQINIAHTTSASPTYITTITNPGIFNINPAVLVINNSNRSIRVYYNSTQKTNGVMDSDFIVVSGTRALLTGFYIADNTSNINFRAITWGEDHRFVPVSITMEVNKVYEITIPVSEEASAITVVEVDASDFYD